VSTVLNWHDKKNINSVTAREVYLSTDSHTLETKNVVLIEEHMAYIHTSPKTDHFKYCIKVF
jgi:hypothetical protein